MRLESGSGESTFAAEEDCGHGRGAVVVVGVKLDSRSKELLTWALVKVAQSGDRVIALHIIDPSADKSSLLELVKTFDAVLAAYEGFCNLKQIDLKLEVRRGSPVRKVLLREANSCGCTSLIIGTSEVHHKIRSRISVAKYCAKNLQNNVSVICVDNGKIVYQRESTSSIFPVCENLEVPESRLKRKKILPKSPLGLPPPVILSSSGNGNESNSMVLVPMKTKEMHEPKPGWSLIRRVFMRGQRVSETPSTKKASIVQWILKLPSRQSVASIYPDQKHLDLDHEKDAIVPYLAETNTIGYSSMIISEEVEVLLEKYSKACQVFSYQELLLATSNFVSDNLIGKGGSSRVYRSCLPEGKKVAVKALNPSEEVLRQFVSEIEIITSLHHKNIISLLGFCFEEDQLLLVYNLLSRGSLEENLHGTQKSGKSFAWEQRYKVALGVAKAVDHLHNAAEPIIHRDVKSSNVLLADDFEPQLSDFGLATWASSSSHHINTSDVAGTFGYLAPEYFMHGKVNQKIDVYAFGVVLLELLSGRKPIDDGPNGQESLVMWAEHVLKEGDFSKLQDPDLVSSCNQDQFERMVLAATLCIRHAPQSRPDITNVLKLLQGDPEVTEWAKQETSNSINALGGEQSIQNIQSFINLALHDVEDDSASISSTEPNISVEDYLKGRWSRSSSFD